uniref:Transcription factor Sp1-like n=1 Tax=Hirondellea gigas TaxID=1518452 RepID=A0A6A7G678_9CRUS
MADLSSVGSIFVCFLCEAEYKDVELLNEHMKEHDDMPAMTTELVNRRRRRKPLDMESVVSESLPAPHQQHKKLKLDTQYISPEQYNNGGTDVSLQIQPTIQTDRQDKTNNISYANANIFKTKSKSTVNNDSRAPPDRSHLFKMEEKQVKKEPGDPSVPASSINMQALRMQKMILAREKRQQEQEEREMKSSVAIIGGDGSQSPDRELEEVQQLLDGGGVFAEHGDAATASPAAAPAGPVLLTAEPINFSVPQLSRSTGAAAAAGALRNKQRLARKKIRNISVESGPTDNLDDMQLLLNSVGSAPVNAASNGTAAAAAGAKIRPTLLVKEVQYEMVAEDEDDTPVLVYMTACTQLAPSCLADLGISLTGQPSYGKSLQNKVEDGLSYDNDFEVFQGRAVRKGTPGRRSQPRDQVTDGDFECEECGKLFRSNSTLKVHMKSHMEVKVLPCPHCEQVFPQRHILQQHLIHEHPTFNLICNYCQKIFTREDTLRSHMVRMHETDGGLNCNVCGKNFPSQGQLEAHVRVHTGERPFRCQLCSRAFVQKVHLRTHLRTMHQTLDAPTTPCHLCDQMVSDRESLRDHVMNVHRLSHSAYKGQVAELRKQGKIPEAVPPKVRIVDPSFRYKKVSVEEMEAMESCDSNSNGVCQQQNSGDKRQRRSNKQPSRLMPFKTQQIKNYIQDDDEEEEEEDDDEEELENYGKQFVARRRDKEELSFVESAFKVAEEMDQQVGVCTSTITPVYYSSGADANNSNSSSDTSNMCPTSSYSSTTQLTPHTPTTLSLLSNTQPTAEDETCVSNEQDTVVMFTM